MQFVEELDKQEQHRQPERALKKRQPLPKTSLP
jgi:hypothetical protein